MTTKILLQELWKQKIDWDDQVPYEIAARWGKSKRELPYLNKLKVPRHILVINPKQIDLIGFCDASMKAYGAVVYLRSIDEEGNVGGF